MRKWIYVTVSAVSTLVITYCTPVLYDAYTRAPETKTGVYVGYIPVSDATTSDPVVSEFSSSTPVLYNPRTLANLTIPELVPKKGKFIAADLENKQLYLYKDGTLLNTYPVLTIGRPGTPWETPAGIYTIHSKEALHYSTIGHVYMRDSMQFYGNYFIHGWPYYANGKPVATTFSGGCIRLSDANAAQVYAFADIGTTIFIYDPKTSVSDPLAFSQSVDPPAVSAQSYLVADIDTGTVFAEQNAKQKMPLGPVTKLVSALVANEVISFEKSVPVAQGSLEQPQNPTLGKRKSVLIGQLLYPMLMDDSSHLAGSIASSYGRAPFVRWMNSVGHAFDMSSSTFTDPNGDATSTVSVADDVFRFASYVYHKKSFIFDIFSTPDKSFASSDGTRFHVNNTHLGLFDSTTTISVVPSTLSSAVVIVPIPQYPDRHAAIIVLNSSNTAFDIETLKAWLGNAPIVAQSAVPQASTTGSLSACVSCSITGTDGSNHSSLRVIQPL